MSAPSRPGAPRSSSRSAARPAPGPGQRPSARRTDAPTTGNVRTSGSRTSQSRPGGPHGPGRANPVAKPRLEPAKARGSWTAMLSWRTAVLAGVVMLALALIMPSLRVYFEQQQQLQQLRTEAAEARSEVKDLHAEAERWEDPPFLVAQARERLAYVFPGETPYRVVDPETVKVEQDDAPAGSGDSATVVGNTWYDTLWGSILVAGKVAETDPKVEVAPDTSVPESDSESREAPADDPATVDTPQVNVDFSE